MVIKGMDNLDVRGVIPELEGLDSLESKPPRKYRQDHDEHVREYWRYLLRILRFYRSRLRLADSLEVTDVCIWFWDNGVHMPNYKNRERILALYNTLFPNTLDEYVMPKTDPCPEPSETIQEETPEERPIPAVSRVPAPPPVSKDPGDPEPSQGPKETREVPEIIWEADPMDEEDEFMEDLDSLEGDEDEDEEDEFMDEEDEFMDEEGL